jgi:microcystin-dependent protein
MNKLLALFLLFFLPAPAQAGVPCSVPFTLTNGSIADATQVMANYNALIACLANAAAAGANSDITSLTGLTTPLTPSFGGTSRYVGNGTTGTVNAPVVASTTPSNFALATGNKIAFLAAGNNSGPTTLNVNGTGIKNVVRIDPGIGSTGLGGGELIGGQMVEVMYDGTSYQIQNSANTKNVGQVFDMGGICPVGSVEAIGQAVSATTFPGLNSLLGTTWGTSSGNVVLPDLRGRSTFGRDSGGSGRITAAGGNFDGTVLGAVGGQQFQVLTAAQIPASGYSFGGTPITNLGLNQNTEFLALGAGGTQTNVLATGSGPGQTVGSTVAWSFGQMTVTFTPGGSVTVPGGGNLHPVLSPAAITIKCIRL